MNLNEKRFDVNGNLKQEFQKCRCCGEIKTKINFVGNNIQCNSCLDYNAKCRKRFYKKQTETRIEETIRRFKNANI